MVKQLKTDYDQAELHEPLYEAERSDAYANTKLDPLANVSSRT
jgi:hypothetical protein